MTPPELSLVVATRGRTHQLERLLHSLAGQSDVRFEVIVVDQNRTDMLAAMLAGSRWPFPLRHVRRPDRRGSSQARNDGWPLATAPVLLFPDDDCWYPAGFLRHGLSLMAAREVSIVTGRSTNEARETVLGRYAAHAGPITPASAWTQHIEWLAFLRRDLVARVGGYDELLGIGGDTPWQAAEGIDLILRALATGARGYYDPALNGFHADMANAGADEPAILKGRHYARGMGFVLRRHTRGLGLRTILYWLLRSIANVGLSAARRDQRGMRYFANVTIGRWEGWRGRVFTLMPPPGKRRR